MKVTPPGPTSSCTPVSSKPSCHTGGLAEGGGAGQVCGDWFPTGATLASTAPLHPAVRTPLHPGLLFLPKNLSWQRKGKGKGSQSFCRQLEEEGPISGTWGEGAALASGKEGSKDREPGATQYLETNRAGAGRAGLRGEDAGDTPWALGVRTPARALTLTPPWGCGRLGCDCGDRAWWQRISVGEPAAEDG